MHEASADAVTHFTGLSAYHSIMFFASAIHMCVWLKLFQYPYRDIGRTKQFSIEFQEVSRNRLCTAKKLESYQNTRASRSRSTIEFY